MARIGGTLFTDYVCTGDPWKGTFECHEEQKAWVWVAIALVVIAVLWYLANRRPHNG